MALNEKVYFRNPYLFRASNYTPKSGTYQAIDHNPWMIFNKTEYDISSNFHLDRYVCPTDGLTMRFVWENIKFTPNSSITATLFIGLVQRNTSVTTPIKLGLEQSPLYFRQSGTSTLANTVSGVPPQGWGNTVFSEIISVNSLVSQPILLNAGDSVFCGLRSGTATSISVTPGLFYNIID
jgi:hypothetical protein